jgi:hypothetical protein
MCGSNNITYGIDVGIGENIYKPCFTSGLNLMCDINCFVTVKASWYNLTCKLKKKLKPL